MFPSITTVAIRYELERTGGNVQGVVERCLRDGRLPEVSQQVFIVRKFEGESRRRSSAEVDLEESTIAYTSIT